MKNTPSLDRQSLKFNYGGVAFAVALLFSIVSSVIQIDRDKDLMPALWLTVITSAFTLLLVLALAITLWGKRHPVFALIPLGIQISLSLILIPYQMYAFRSVSQILHNDAVYRSIQIVQYFSTFTSTIAGICLFILISLFYIKGVKKSTKSCLSTILTVAAIITVIFSILNWSMRVLSSLDVLRSDVTYIYTIPELICSILTGMATAAARVITGRWLVDPYKEGCAPDETGIAASGEKSAYSFTANTPYAQDVFTPVSCETGVTFGVSLPSHILLIIFAGVIWLPMWIYRTSEATRHADGDFSDPMTSLLLCLFVPFYGIYWTYKTAGRIDKMAGECGIYSDLCTACLLLALLIPIVPPILMQSKINEIQEAK